MKVANINRSFSNTPGCLSYSSMLKASNKNNIIIKAVTKSSETTPKSPAITKEFIDNFPIIQMSWDNPAIYDDDDDTVELKKIGFNRSDSTTSDYMSDSSTTTESSEKTIVASKLSTSFDPNCAPFISKTTKSSEKTTVSEKIPKSSFDPNCAPFIPSTKTESSDKTIVATKILKPSFDPNCAPFIPSAKTMELCRPFSNGKNVLNEFSTTTEKENTSSTTILPPVNIHVVDDNQAQFNIDKETQNSMSEASAEKYSKQADENKKPVVDEICGFQFFKRKPEDNGVRNMPAKFRVRYMPTQRDINGPIFGQYQLLHKIKDLESVLNREIKQQRFVLERLLSYEKEVHFLSLQLNSFK